MLRGSLLRGKRLAGAITAILSLISVGSCDDDDPLVTYNEPIPLALAGGELCARWADMTLYTLRFSAFNTPTYSSRSLGYLGVAMYEAVVPAADTHNSLSGQLSGLVVPEVEVGEKYQWSLCLNAAQQTLLKLLYPAPGNSHRYVHEKIDGLAKEVYDVESAGIDPDISRRSLQFGESIALAVYQWSTTDGGDKGYMRNFDPTFLFPSGNSYWIPPGRGQTVSPFPLHPHWGKNRTFLTLNGSLAIPALIPFSTDPSSEYYKKYYEVYSTDPLLTQEEMEIAAWWGDDPTETFSPPGHSYHMTTLAVRKSGASMISAAEAYARVGIAVGDAFIHCWKAKYTYFNERPSSYIKKYIDPSFVQFWPEPPFPAFPSGHSIQASAAATVLTDLFGDSFAFTDRVHEGNRRYDDFRFLSLKYPARSFSSFWEAANECANSRLLGGIHTRQDNEAGITDGKTIGNNVNALEWRK
jgi:hypothetical protein